MHLFSEAREFTHFLSLQGAGHLVNKAQGFSAHLSQRVSNSSFAREYVTPGS